MNVNDVLKTLKVMRVTSKYTVKLKQKKELVFVSTAGRRRKQRGSTMIRELLLFAPVSHIVEDFVKRLRSTYILVLFSSSVITSIEPTDFEIQDDDKLLVSGSFIRIFNLGESSCRAYLVLSLSLGEELLELYAATDSSNLTKPNQKDQVVLEDSPENLANNNMVTKHGFKDSERSDEEESETKHPLRTGKAPRLHKLRRSPVTSRDPTGVDYNEIFSPVVKMTTIRLVLSIIATENLYLEQLDVKTAFLHGDLDEYIYMTQPQRVFSQLGKKKTSCAN
ncbi:retrovirus-related pol polyprotein from transposon TNT 1-94 [Tanacetum coccineum]